MKKQKHNLFYQVVFWSVISAAFIGPGTVTTALKSGALFDLGLLWAILFSILACYVLQESVSRIAIITGMDLPEIIASRFGNKKILNVHHLLIFCIVFGCMAYQAGNMTGTLAGMEMLFHIPKYWLIIPVFGIAFLFLWNGRIQIISRFLGILVGMMACIFIYMSLQIDTSLLDIIDHLFIPRVPTHSAIYVIALTGTTIVPYNLFLGSGISHGQKLSDTRFGLGMAILIGGIITISLLISGTLLSSDFSFEGVYHLLTDRLGKWAGTGFAFGLFAAGLSSSITAPLAAAITVKSMIREKSKNQNQSNRLFRITWISVLAVGTLFSLLSYSPDVLIISAQAINGLILPFIAYYLYVLINDPAILPGEFKNATGYNLLMLLVTAITIFLGMYHFLGVVIRLFIEKQFMVLQTTLALVLTAFLIFRLLMITSRLSH